MSDDADRAQLQDEYILPAAIARARHSTEYGYSMGICLGCGNEIPEKRMIAMDGCTYCVRCLNLKDKGLL